ncbi:hypothetical protein [Mucilaginibacter sp.]|uniref:hypothetical protein n=1 Tax=Mucilaginibacter sp. TaxID=1882438 RepID=UPI002621A961|nr:hypothetical protein [Mucilaginibacter sp.]MDB4918777.1 hypothetical protein [Mucilaginibacter sp.]
MTKDKNIKTTCNKKSISKVLPAPTAEVVAEIVGVSESYVKKVRTGTRPDKSPAADAVKYCNELLIDGQKLLVQTVAEIMHSKQIQQ